jgi:tRNA(Arg) A34 adenosine deaminase TadA
VEPQPLALVLTLPIWIDEVVARFPAELESDEQRMELTIALSRENAARGGGPFGAAVFAGNALLAAGVNCVLSSGFSIAHAEIVALMAAQQTLAGAAAGSAAPAALALYASTEPCCQCFGAIVWSGVSRLVCGAVTADAEAIGFDEGPKPDAWQDKLAVRGINVRCNVLGAEAKAVLDGYARAGGVIYGSGLRAP